MGSTINTQQTNQVIHVYSSLPFYLIQILLLLLVLYKLLSLKNVKKKTEISMKNLQFPFLCFNNECKTNRNRWSKVWRSKNEKKRKWRVPFCACDRTRWTWTRSVLTSGDEAWGARPWGPLPPRWFLQWFWSLFLSFHPTASTSSLPTTMERRRPSGGARECAFGS